MEINKKPRGYHRKQTNMFKRVDTVEDLPDHLENIDLSRNIILCTPSKLGLFKYNIDGTISLNLDREENLSATKITRDGTVGIIEYFPKLKIIVPQGIKLNIDSPSFQFCFFDKIYPSCKMFYQGAIDEDSKEKAFNELPPYVAMTDFQITFHIDLLRLREKRGSFLLKKGQSVANLYFVELPHFREFGQELEKIIYLRDTEVFDTFLDVF